MQVAEEGVLPAAEGVVRHRHGDRHVDADHADVDLELELAGDTAVAGEDRDAVPVRIFVHEPQGLVVGRNAGDAEHRAEDLVLVDVHLRLDVVEQRDAEEEPSAVGRSLAAVSDDGGALVAALVDVRRDLVAMLARDERPHLGIGLHPVADLHLRQALLDRPNELVARVADRNQHRDRHAALARRAVARRDGRVGGHVDIGVGQDDHVILRAAERLHALPM
ncbi:MAG: hypothetical protein AUG88_06270 [Actinobacteria bacterium 13_1_20CM_4_68_12]|nr:MAG: hypothetical protein AUG88_06270 [Actinobacteria bacterium 13_1_20CM_4_68_12]